MQNLHELNSRFIKHFLNENVFVVTVKTNDSIAFLQVLKQQLSQLYVSHSIPKQCIESGIVQPSGYRLNYLDIPQPWLFSNPFDENCFIEKWQGSITIQNKRKLSCNKPNYVTFSVGEKSLFCQNNCWYIKVYTSYCSPEHFIAISINEIYHYLFLDHDAKVNEK